MATRLIPKPLSGTFAGGGGQGPILTPVVIDTVAAGETKTVDTVSIEFVPSRKWMIDIATVGASKTLELVVSDTSQGITHQIYGVSGDIVNLNFIVNKVGTDFQLQIENLEPTTLTATVRLVI